MRVGRYVSLSLGQMTSLSETIIPVHRDSCSISIINVMQGLLINIMVPMDKDLSVIARHKRGLKIFTKLTHHNCLQLRVTRRKSMSM